MADFEETKLLFEVGKFAFEAIFNNPNLKIDKKIKAYSSVVDYLKVEGKTISIDTDIYNVFVN